MPKNAVNLKRMIGAHHGVLLVTPEYNSSVPALVKNSIDWVSRVQDPNETRGQVFRERAFAIASASASRLGGTRALAALRLILSACHATVVPNQLALSFADDAYDEIQEPRVRIVTLSLATAERFGEIFASLRKRGKPIPTNDIWIAAQSIENDSELLSGDPHFGFVENLSWLPLPAR